MLRIGLTGGIGSGKTTVSDRFSALGAPVIDTDVLAREVVVPGEPALGKLVDRFGPGLLHDEGTLNRARLREIVFADPDARKETESILHPAILKRLNAKLTELEKQRTIFCIIVVPLLVETNFREIVDRILTIEAPSEARIRRVLNRGEAITREEIDTIIEAQASPEERCRVAHDVIYNDGNLEELYQKVDRMHTKYLAMSK